MSNGVDPSVRSAGLPPLPERPLVSVVIPAYNAESYVLDAIAGVLLQAYEPLEILVVDDGSRDGTVALLEREAPRVRVIRQANAGAAAARNTGLRAARGELICLLDADDGWFPGKLLAQLEHLRSHPEAGMVFHQWMVLSPDGQGRYAHPASGDEHAAAVDPECSGWIYSQLLLDCVVHTSTVMLRRQVVEDIGFFDTSLVNGEDYNYWLRVSRRYEIHKLAGVYSFYREVAGSLTNQGVPRPENYEYGVISRAIQQWGLASPDGRAISRAQAAQRLGKLAFDFGLAHFSGGSLRTANAAFRASLQHEPLRAKAWLFLLMTAFGIRRRGW